MALPILDGNQSATTLSSVVTGGEHIVAHSVVSLGTTAIANITSAVSGAVVTIPALSHLGNSVATDGVADATTNFVKIGGHQSGSNQTAHIVHVSTGGAMSVDATDSVVSISNFPATQTVAGTVTAYAVGKWNQGGNVYIDKNIATDSIGQTLINASVNAQSVFSYDGQSHIFAKLTPNTTVTIGSLPAISGTVTVGNSVTIGSLPTLTPQLPRVTFIDGSGTVTTANTAVTVFASSTTRSYLLVQVTTGSAFVNVGATATTVNGISLTAGQGYAWETTIPQGLVSLISTTTNSAYVAKQA